MTIKRINRGRGHSYTIDGEKAIGVTTAISEAWPQPWMGPWSAKSVAQAAVDMDRNEWLELLAKGREGAVMHLKGAPARLRNTAAARGTEVHKIAERVQAGEEVAVPEHLYGHVESVAKFLDDWQVVPLLVEKTVASYRYGYAGTFDMVADIGDGRRILFDYKTSSSIKETCALQLAAYKMADFYLADNDLEMPVEEIGIDECAAVHVRADGYDVVPLNTGPDVFTAFLHTLRVAQAYKNCESWVYPAAENPRWSEVAA